MCIMPLRRTALFWRMNGGRIVPIYTEPCIAQKIPRVYFPHSLLDRLRRKSTILYVIRIWIIRKISASKPAAVYKIYIISIVVQRRPDKQGRTVLLYNTAAHNLFFTRYTIQLLTINLFFSRLIVLYIRKNARHGIWKIDRLLGTFFFPAPLCTRRDLYRQSPRYLWL